MACELDAMNGPLQNHWPMQRLHEREYGNVRSCLLFGFDWRKHRYNYILIKCKSLVIEISSRTHYLHGNCIETVAKTNFKTI